ncbi:MAG: ABC transporter permease [Acidobacteriota bacterium]
MSAIPLIYNLRSVRVRWRSNLVAVLGIAGVVAVFVAMLSLAKGFRQTLVQSGSPTNAIVLRGGATTEMESVITRDQMEVIADAPGVAHDAQGRPMVSGELFVIAPFHHRASDAAALAPVRGVSAEALRVHRGVRIVQGRFFRPGLPELVVGRNAENIYSGLRLGDEPRFGGRTWRVVGIMNSGGSAFDSEVWADEPILSQTYKRPADLFSSVTVRLASPSALTPFKRALESDPRLTVRAQRETTYYADQSRAVSKVITVLGFLVASVMGVGAVFGAFNTLYASVAARAREIATLRAMGFGGVAVALSFVTESLLVAFAGGIVGCLAVWPVNGLTTSTLNWQSFSQVAFAFRVAPSLLARGLLFALAMGFVGGLVPALRAARLPVAVALREL